VACAKRGGYTVALLPADTSTQLFWGHIYDKWFERPDRPDRTTAAKTGSMLVYFVDHRVRDVMPLRDIWVLPDSWVSTEVGRCVCGAPALSYKLCPRCFEVIG
jgi:hypothetical protein